MSGMPIIYPFIGSWVTNNQKFSFSVKKYSSCSIIFWTHLKNPTHAIASIPKLVSKLLSKAPPNLTNTQNKISYVTIFLTLKSYQSQFSPIFLSNFLTGLINKIRVDAYWPETYWLLTTFPNILILKKIPGNLDGCYDTIAKKGGTKWILTLSMALEATQPYQTVRSTSSPPKRQPRRPELKWFAKEMFKPPSQSFQYFGFSINVFNQTK